jgi:hypothetical protein
VRFTTRESEPDVFERIEAFLMGNAHAPSGPNSVDRVGLAVRSSVPPYPTDLEHTLAMVSEEVR